MTDTEQAGSSPAAQTRVQIDPMAALGETQALADFYRNRNLLLANELHALRGTVAELQARVAEQDNGTKRPVDGELAMGPEYS